MNAYQQELLIRKDYLNDNTIETIYFGGGTPSVLTKDNVHGLLNLVRLNYNISPDPEITFEANPDDLSFEYLVQLHSIGINRLSIGVQSFHDHDLQFMGRRHNAQQAIEAIKNAQQAGFTNISVDFIYGIPGMSLSQWEYNLDLVFSLDIQHLSAYHLTYHEGTVLWSKLQKGSISEIEEEDSLRQFELLIDKSERNGFIQYEISNFAKNGFYSKHNSSYWKQIEYLGLGPSSHSYNKKTRYWNPSDINSYLTSIESGNPAGEFETLSLTDNYNDYVITSLRTIWGIDKWFINNEFGSEIFNHLEKEIQRFLISGMIVEKGDHYFITKKGIFISDNIIEGLIL